KLRFQGELESLGHPVAFEALCQKAGRMEWVVYAKRPFGGPEQVLKYLPRRHFQPAPVIDGGRSSHLRMEGLCRRQSDQDDDIGGGRIYSSFSPSRAALRLCSHPSFWLSGQPQTKGKTGAVPVLAG